MQRCPGCFEGPLLSGEGNGKGNVCPRCGFDLATHKQSLMSLGLGTILGGRYEIGRVLGSGGFGITYLAFDHRLQVAVAVKEYLPRALAARRDGETGVIIHSESAMAEFAHHMAAFREEARTLARFNQEPGIVSVLDHFEENGTAYIVMMHVDGVTVEHWLKLNGGKVSFEQAMAILLPVMDSLDVVHAAGIIHRDISPDNILVTRTRQVRLLDFGAARSFSGEEEGTVSILLKRGYAPPEQYRGKRQEQGPWTDIYSMAATLYRMLTGAMPEDVIGRMQTGALVPPSEKGVELPPYAESVLMQALSLRCEDRPRSMKAFRNVLLGGRNAVAEVDLERELLQREVSLPVPPIPPRKKRFLAIPWVALLSVLLLLGIFALTSWIRGMEQANAVAASTQSSSDQPSTDQPSTDQPTSDQPTSDQSSVTPDAEASAGISMASDMTPASGTGSFSPEAGGSTPSPVASISTATPVPLLEMTMETEIVIQDPALAAALRKVMGIPREPIRYRDALKMTRLELDELEITDISALHYFRNLGFLSLRGNAITSIDALSGLPQLRELNAGDNKITSLDGLTDLPSLNYYYVQGNPVEKMDSVLRFPNLVNIEFNSCGLTELVPLQTLPNLRNIGIYDNAITDLSGFEGQTHLNELNFGINPIKSLEPLRGMKTIRKLNLEKTEITSLEPLRDLYALEDLLTDGSPVVDAEALPTLTGLTRLSLIRSKLTSLPDLTPLTKLRELYLFGTPLEDRTNLIRVYPQLERVDVGVEELR